MRLCDWKMGGDPNVKLVLDCHTDLGESPVWDARTGRLYFVDINEKQIHVYTPSDEKHFVIDAPVSLPTTTCDFDISNKQCPGWRLSCVVAIKHTH